MINYTASRFLWIALILALTLAGFSGYTVRAQSCSITPAPGTFTGTITTDDPTQTGRITRDGNPSDCNGKAFPGIFNSTNLYHYDQYTFTNTGASAACVLVTLNATPDSGVHSVAYLNSFNPASIQTNYVGDLGVLNTASTNESYSFSVPAGANFVVVVHETTVNAGGTYSLTVGCTTPPPPLLSAGQVLISEFRLSGPGASGSGSARDEFIELYNNTDAAVDLSGYALRAYDPNFNAAGSGADFVQALPSGAIVPARGHYLIGDSGAYSLTTYAPLDFDTAPLFGGDFFIDNEGVQLVTPNLITVIDSVGFSGSGGRAGENVVYAEGTPLTRRTSTPPTVQYAYVRRYDSNTGRPVDTNNNASDFILTSVTGTTFTAAAGGTVPSVLGAPGPQGTTSPLPKTNSQLLPSLIEPMQATTNPPNRVRDLTVVPNGAQGTLSIRRRFTNNSGTTMTLLRFRVIDITTLGSPTPAPPQVDLRAITSGDAPVSPTTSTGITLVQGTTLDQPPTQPLGGGLNSSLSVALLGGGLASTSGGVCPAGSTCSVNVQFLLGVNGSGRFRFFVFQEALP